MAPTAIVVPVLAASSSTERWRRAYTEDGAAGMPSHVTLLYPFVDDERLSHGDVSEVGRAVAAVPPFDFALVRFAMFPGPPPVLHLAPDPAEPFRALTEALVRAFPGYPPYGGAFGEVVPHVTVAAHDDAPADEIRAAIEPELPLRERAAETWIVHRVDGCWRMRNRMPLGAA